MKVATRGGPCQCRSVVCWVGRLGDAEIGVNTIPVESAKIPRFLSSSPVNRWGSLVENSRFPDLLWRVPRFSVVVSPLLPCHFQVLGSIFRPPRLAETWSIEGSRSSCHWPSRWFSPPSTWVETTRNVLSSWIFGRRRWRTVSGRTGDV